MSGDGWRLSAHPEGMIEAIEHHLEYLTKQLLSGDVVESVSSADGGGGDSSEVGRVLRETLSLSKVLARVAGISENYGELKKGHDLISFTVEMVQNLLKLVREMERREGRERERKGGERREEG